LKEIVSILFDDEAIFAVDQNVIVDVSYAE
jgi:hypothetical protein